MLFRSVTVSQTGNGFDGYVGVEASAGSPDHGHIGNINVSMTGNNNVLGAHISAGYFSGGAIGAFTQSQIGDVTVAVNGDNNTFSAGVWSLGGDIGNVSLTVTGDGNNAHVSGLANHTYYYDTHNDAADNNQSGYYDQGGGNVGNVTLTVNGDSSGGISIYASGGSVGNITVSADNSAAANIIVKIDPTPAYMHSDNPMANIGNVTVYVGAESYASGSIHTSGGSIGNVSVTLNGANASGALNLQADRKSGGAGYVGGTASYNDYAGGGNIGNVNLSIDGSNAHYTLAAIASGGSVGNVTASVNGAGASGDIFLGAQIVGSGSPGGNVGTIGIDIGANASMHLGFNVDAAMGAVTATGGNGSYFEMSGGGGLAGNVPSSGGSGGSGGIAGLAAVGLHVATPVLVADPLGGNASIASVSLNFGNNGHEYVIITDFSGSVGGITGTFGNNNHDVYQFGHVTQNVGAITLTEGAGADTQIRYGQTLVLDSTVHTDFIPIVTGGTLGAVTYTAGAGSSVDISVQGNFTSMGAVTLIGGDSSSSASVNLGGLVPASTDVGVENIGYSIGSMGGVAASSWAGDLTVNLASVGASSPATAVGTTVRVGSGGSTVTGTEGADNIFLGAGHDEVRFDPSITPDTHTDTIFGFTAGAGGDTLVLPAGIGGSLHAVYTADTAASAASGDVFRLVDIAAGQDIKTVAGLATALNAGGEYASLDDTAGAHFTIITAATSTSQQLYVFDVNDSDGTITAADITLVGIVNETTAGTGLGNLVIANLGIAAG